MSVSPLQDGCRGKRGNVITHWIGREAVGGAQHSIHVCTQAPRQVKAQTQVPVNAAALSAL